MILLEFLCNSALINVHFLPRANNNVPNLSEAVAGNSLFLSSREKSEICVLAFCLKLSFKDFGSVGRESMVAPLLSDSAPCNWDSSQSTRLVASRLPVGAGMDTSFPPKPR